METGKDRVASLLFLLRTLEAKMRIDISFDNNGTKLAGHLYLPDNRPEGARLPAVVVTGAWTTVKEQMPAVYASALADRGYAALTFDFRGWGASPDGNSFLEDPSRKTSDILVALEFLASRPEVDSERIGGLGICASSGYMSAAAAQSHYLRALALVAPWLHDSEIVEQVYGGTESVANLIQLGRDAANSAKPVFIEAASSENEQALMYQAPYYTEKDRGLIPEYDNKFNVASWEPWLTFDAIAIANDLAKPTLLVHSEAAAIPQGAKRFIELAGDNAHGVWLENVSQFDFYDASSAVKESVLAVEQHFSKTFRTASEQEILDKLHIRTVVESVPNLADRGDFESLEKLYANEVEVDYTSLGGGEVEVKSARALMNEWASLLPGFDATDHRISDIVTTVEGDTAHVACKVHAEHRVANQRWSIEGTYDFKLHRQLDRWLIVFHRFNLVKESGSRDVFELAISNAKRDSPTYVKRQKTENAVREFLGALEEKDMERFASVWADDAVQHMPYAPENFPERVVGKENILKHYANWPENAGAANFTSDLVFYPMSDPEMVFAEFKGDVDVIPTQRKYQQSYGGLFHVADGKITLFREYFNPGPFVYAFALE